MTSSKIRGRAWKFGDNIDTDQIIPAKYCNTFDAEALALHVMEGADPEFARKVAPGDILVAGRNFGCGSSREAAPLAIKASHIEVVIAHSFARLFFRNAVNVGLPVLVSPAAAERIEQGEELEIDVMGGIIYSRTANLGYRARQFTGIVQEIIDSGGMVAYIREHLQADQRKSRETPKSG